MTINTLAWKSSSNTTISDLWMIGQVIRTIRAAPAALSVLACIGIPVMQSRNDTSRIHKVYIIFKYPLLRYLAFKYSYPLTYIMRAAIFLSAFLCTSLAAASAAIDAFKRVDRVLESRTATQHHAPVHNQAQLQKRASPYLNSATQSGCIKCAIPRPETDQAPEFVVNGTNIPDVDVS